MGDSTIASEVPAEVGGPVIVPREPRGVGRSANVPQELPWASPFA